MIKLAVSIPKEIAIGVSGGADSMALLDFLRRKHNCHVLHLNHGTGDFANESETIVSKYCKRHNISCDVKQISKDETPSTNKEFIWANVRHEWFNEFERPVVLAHHLNDEVEKWIWSSLNGNPRLSKLKQGNIIRPILTTPKETLIKWCERNNVPYIHDPTNNDGVSNMRSILRANMEAYKSVNPGIENMVRRKILRTPQN